MKTQEETQKIGANLMHSKQWAIPPARLAHTGRNLERPWKRSQGVSWNSPREYGWDAPNPII